MTIECPSTNRKPLKAYGLLRSIGGFWKIFATVVAVAMAVYHVYILAFQPLDPWLIRIMHIQFVMAIGFVYYAGWPGATRRVNSFDILFILMSLSTMVYVLYYFDDLVFRAGVFPEGMDVLFGLFAVVTVIELTRRTVGNALTIMVLLFISYCFLGPYLPGFFWHRGYSFRARRKLPIQHQRHIQHPFGCDRQVCLHLHSVRRVPRALGRGELLYGHGLCRGRQDPRRPCQGGGIGQRPVRHGQRHVDWQRSHHRHPDHPHDEEGGLQRLLCRGCGSLRLNRRPDHAPGHGCGRVSHGFPHRAALSGYHGGFHHSRAALLRLNLPHGGYGVREERPVRPASRQDSQYGVRL